MNKEFEEVNLRLRLNPMFQKQTVPYHDLDDLQRMVVTGQAETAIIIVQQVMEEMKMNAEQKEETILALHQLFNYSKKLYDFAKYEYTFSQKVMVQNMRMRKHINQLEEEIKFYKL